MSEHSDAIIKYALLGALARMGAGLGKSLWKRKGLTLGAGLTALEVGGAAGKASNAASDAYRAANLAESGARMMGNTF